MDARELTPIVQKNKDELYLLKKKVEQMEAEHEKFRLLLDDLRIDVAMLQKH